MFIFISFLFSCGLETAKPGKNTEVVIASNFLFPKDVRFYKGFQKRTGIHVKIIHLSSDSINKHLQKFGYNSEFDLLFLNSLRDMKRLKKNKFHEFNYSATKSELKLFKPIMKNQWLIVGIDPYVFSYYQDSTERPKTYKELTKNFLWATPNEEDLDVFLAQVKYHLRKNKTYKKWKADFERNQVTYDVGTDSSSSQQFLLLKASAVKRDSTLSMSKGRVVYFPNQTKNGFYADRYGMALVEQAKNFENAKRLLLYINQYRKIPAPFEIMPLKSKKSKQLNKLSEETILDNL
jgi:hypothetical protein